MSNSISTSDFINLPETKRRIKITLRQLKAMRKAEKKLNKIGVTITNLSLNTESIVVMSNTP